MGEPENAAGRGAGDASYENRNTYTYDEVGNLTSTTDGNGNKMTYTYDLLSNQTSRTNALGETESYSYNLNNRLEKITRPNGNTIQYDYNKLDALLQTDYSEEADGQVLYTYDEEGKRLSMSDLTGTSTYQYDADGRITGVQQGDGSVILYNYDSYGNLAKMHIDNNRMHPTTNVWPKLFLLRDDNAYDRLSKKKRHPNSDRFQQRNREKQFLL